MNEVQIRRAVLADLPAVGPLLSEADELHRDALPWLFQPAAEGSVAHFLEPYVSDVERAMFVAVAHDGALAGVLYLFLRQPARAPIVRPTVVAEIDSLAVSSACRRQGVGTRLVEAALDWARGAGATRTELGAYEFNAAARGFWSSVGFETLSRRLVLRSG